MSGSNVSSRLPGDDLGGGGDVGHRPSPAAPNPKPHSSHEEAVAKAKASIHGEVRGKCCDYWPECSHVYEAVTGEPWVHHTDPIELREWIADWRNGQFSSSSRDEHGWPIEMHGLVADLENLIEQLEALRRTTYDATPVDCLIAELRDAFMVQPQMLTRERFEERVAQFKAEVASNPASEPEAS